MKRRLLAIGVAIVVLAFACEPQGHIGGPGDAPRYDKGAVEKE